MQSDVLSRAEIQRVLADLKENDGRFSQLFLVWLSIGLRNAEIRDLMWYRIRWEEGELLACKSLRRDGYS